MPSYTKLGHVEDHIKAAALFTAQKQPDSLSLEKDPKDKRHLIAKD
jgi:hypothetical protein